jgi:hypothetical protein
MFVIQRTVRGFLPFSVSAFEVPSGCRMARADHFGKSSDF